nr:aminopeptidase N-like isoform X1 [Leptinotarsa decemlineata]
MNMIRVACLFLVCLLAVDGYRLPKDVIPEHYKLEIISYLGEKDNFNFDGKVWIRAICVHPSQNITLHSKDLEIKDGGVTLKDTSTNDSKAVKISQVEFEKDNDFLIIHLNELLKKNHKYEIFISFRGKSDDGLAGFYRSSYYDKKKHEKVWLGVTQFEAISARMAFPCFDEPEMKATFDISIGRKDGYKAISNMPLVITEPLKEKEGWFWDRFDRSVPMSTYLVAYIVSDFHHKTADTAENNNVTFRVWARKDALNQVDFAKEVGPKALEYYEKFFDIKYPLPKQDMVAIPDFSAGAMENWGLITYREAYLLYDPKVSSKTSQHSVASVIAHELAHQWFGNLVTMKWWTDLWLNEGFATYMASLAVEELFPQWNSLQEEAADNLLGVFSFDSLMTSHPVSVPIGDPKEIDEIFDTISYKKGSSLIRMMSLFLSEGVLRKGVSNYLRKHKFSNAEQDDLWECLTEEAHKTKVLPKNLTVKVIMDTWTLQTGYPVITVKRDYNKKSADITQRRYLRDIIDSRDSKNSCWWVPLSYSTRQNLHFNITTPDHWLSCPMEKQVIENIADENDWVVFNNEMAGIYKINYDDRNWEMITNFLQSEEYRKIPTLNRVQLINDAADLAFVGNLKYDIFFDLLNYLKIEEEYLPWKAALGKTSGITTHLKKSSIYGLYKDYMRQLLTPIYEKVGGLEIPTSSADKLDSIKLQVLIASKACKFEVANCIAHSQNLFKKLKENPRETNIIPKDLRGVVYCTTLKHGGEMEWEFLWKQYQNSNVATEKGTLLNALGCTQEIWLLTRYLEWSMNDTRIRRQDSSTVFSSVARNDIGYYIAKNFFYENVNQIFKHLQPNKRRISRYLSSLANQMTDEKDLQELEHFIDENKENFSEVKKGVEQSLETVKINVQWQNKHADAIHKVLTKYSKD